MRSYPTRRTLRAAGVAFALLACTAILPARAIVGGTLDPNANLAPFGGVASVTGAGRLGSTVLIGRDYALTAAHVVFGTAAAAWTINFNAGSDLSSQLAVETFFLAPGYAGFITDPVDGLVHNDLAVLKLAAPAPIDVPIYPIVPLLPNAVLTFVGYGGSGGFAGPLAPASPMAKYNGSNTADQFFAKPGLGTPPVNDIFAFDVDAGTADATLAGGDSGGAAFVNVGGQWQLAGINTFVFTASVPNGINLSGGGGMVLSAYQPWIEQVTGIPEPGTWAMLLAGLCVLMLIRRGTHDDVVRRRRASQASIPGRTPLDRTSKNTG